MSNHPPNQDLQRSKPVALLLLLVLCFTSITPQVTASSSTSSSQQVTCANHPSWQKVKPLLKSVSIGVESVQSSLKNLIIDYENQQMTQSPSSLGICSQFQGAPSCCTSQMTDFLDKFMILRAKQLLYQDSTIRKFLKSIFVQLSKSQILVSQNVQIPPTVEALIQSSDGSNASLVALLAQEKQCKLDFVKVITAQTRGAVCSICANANDQSSNRYFDSNNRLQISQNSLGLFQTDIQNALDCFASALSDDAIQTISTGLLKNYIQDKYLQSSVSKIMSLFSKSSTSGGFTKSTQGPTCDGINVFSDDLKCNSAVFGTQKQSDYAANLYPTSVRVLQDASSSTSGDLIDSTSSETVTVPIGGVNIYIKSSVDSQFTYSGNMVFNAIYEGSASNSQIIEIITGLFLTLFTLLA